jgi:hypothetical protein
MPLYNGQQDPFAHVLDFLETTVFGYAVGDIRRLGQVRPDPVPPNLRGCTVPECLSIFAVLDLLGFLMRGDFDDETKLDLDRLIANQVKNAPPPQSDIKILKRIADKARKSSDNLKYMFDKWLCQQSQAYDELHRDLIIKLFRNGGAHQFIPKAAGIAKWGRPEPLIKFRKAPDGFPLPVLNQDLFREDVLAILERIRRTIKNKDDNELMIICGEAVEVLATRMSKRLIVRHWLDRDMLRSILMTHKPDVLYANIFQDVRPVLPTV